MIKIDVCNQDQQIYDNYQDPDTSRRHVRKADCEDAQLTVYTDKELTLVIEVDGVETATRDLSAKVTKHFDLAELLTSSQPQSSSLSRLIGLGGSARVNVKDVREFKAVLRETNAQGRICGSIIFALQNESEFDAVYSNRVEARRSRPDAPLYTNDATSAESGFPCWHCSHILSVGTTHCPKCDSEQ